MTARSDRMGQIYTAAENSDMIALTGTASAGWENRMTQGRINGTRYYEAGLSKGEWTNTSTDI
eukprot:5364587-Pyramimonas_sp.AAC.1